MNSRNPVMNMATTPPAVRGNISLATDEIGCDLNAMPGNAGGPENGPTEDRQCQQMEYLHNCKCIGGIAHEDAQMGPADPMAKLGQRHNTTQPFVKPSEPGSLLYIFTYAISLPTTMMAGP